MESERTRPFTLVSLGTTNQTLVNKGPSVLFSVYVINVNAAVRYLKFYDLAAAPTAGTGKPKRIFAIPGNTAGAGFCLSPVIPMGFDNGIAFTIVTGVADTDATAVTANDVILNLEYIGGG